MIESGPNHTDDFASVCRGGRGFAMWRRNSFSRPSLHRFGFTYVAVPHGAPLTFRAVVLERSRSYARSSPHLTPDWMGPPSMVGVRLTPNRNDHGRNSEAFFVRLVSRVSGKNRKHAPTSQPCSGAGRRSRGLDRRSGEQVRMWGPNVLKGGYWPVDCCMVERLFVRAVHRSSVSRVPPESDTRVTDAGVSREVRCDVLCQ